MSPEDAIEKLGGLLDREKDRVVRLWGKRVRQQTPELEIDTQHLREPMAQMVDELARLCKTRGLDAITLWPEWVRSHGARRYAQHYDADDLAREFKLLAQVLFHVYARRYGALEPQIAEVIVELVGEADAAVQASFARVLRTEEVRFRDAAVMETVLHHVDVGILVAEVDGTLSFATPPAAKLLGVPVRALVGGKAQALLGPVLTQLGARRTDGQPFRIHDIPLVTALKEHRVVRGTMMTIRRRDGREKLLELSAIPLWDEQNDNELAGVIQTVVDRTESAEKTQELQRAYEEMRMLQGRLLQRTRTQALGQLASGAAHALNNFLNVLRLRITLLRRGAKPEHLDALDRTVRNIGDLVARLQEFSVQRTEEQLADTSFDAVVRDSLALSRSELERPDAPIQVETELTAEGEVHVDVGFFRELVVNLLLAARDRMPQGGNVVVRTRDEADWEVLEVQDSAAPLTVDEVQKLFDPLKGKGPFAQLSLLLAVARNQVHRWGGELEVRPGASGNTFRLQLPRVKEAAKQPVRHEEPIRRRHAETHRLLVVDDEPENARMLADVLAEEGYDVAVAHSGAEALRAWESSHFDAALLDALMPDVSGWDLAREIRKRSPDALLALVTGLDVRGQNRQNLALVDAVFRKPVDVGALDDFLSQSPPRVPALEEGRPPLLHS